MRWVILTVKGMPEGKALAVVYGDVDELRVLPSGRGAEIPEEAWQGLKNELLGEEQADLI